MINCILHKSPTDDEAEYTVTQRPSIDISEDSSTIGHLNNRARGIYYWEENEQLYIIHDNDVYEDSQDSTRIGEASGTFAAGSERCTMLETIGTPKLVILDAENNQGFTMTAAKALNVIASNFPSTLAHGGAILNTHLFVMDEDGRIYNSAVDDPDTFPATGFLKTERENDKGVYLAKHKHDLMSLNTRTIEFFYYANNPSGSPLNRREDISYNIGCVSGTAVWEDGDVTYFLGSNPSGQIAIYKMENYRPIVISNDSMNSYLTQGLTHESLKITMSGFSAMGHSILILTVYTLTGASPGEIVPKQTFIIDETTGLMGVWATLVNSQTTLPVMAWTKRTGGQNATLAARTGEGILSNGDIINVNDKLIPVDTVLAGDGVYEDGVYEPDVYVGGGSDVGTNILCTVRTGQKDFGAAVTKFQNLEQLMMNNTASSQTLTIKHSDDSNTDFDVGNTIDTSQNRKEIYQGGSFIRRNYQLEYFGSEQIFMEKLMVDAEAGD